MTHSGSAVANRGSRTAQARPAYERVLVERGRRSGASIAIAVHSTKLGPALGGARLWHYANDSDAVADAKRLARAMTFKAAAAGLDLGGGKGVIAMPSAEPPEGELRRAALLDFGDLVESLGGAYITAEDVGTSAQDMVVVAERTRHVTGMPAELGGAGDPSPFTAAGVQAAMRAVCAATLGTRWLRGVEVIIVGMGHVGEHLARGLAAAGATLGLSDIRPERAALAEELGARWLEPREALTSRCHVLAPCAVGGAIHELNVDALRCRAVCGAANNQLADDALADRLADRAIIWAPDFIANAGGLINVYRELRGYDADRALELTLGIEGTMERVLATARRRGSTPLDAARELALARLEAR